MFTVSELNIYPVKSLGGYSVTEAAVTETGFSYDRRWMLIDEENKSLTQRDFNVMALLTASIESEALVIRHKNKLNSLLKLPAATRAGTIYSGKSLG